MNTVFLENFKLKGLLRDLLDIIAEMEADDASVSMDAAIDNPELLKRWKRLKAVIESIIEPS